MTKRQAKEANREVGSVNKQEQQEAKLRHGDDENHIVKKHFESQDKK